MTIATIIAAILANAANESALVSPVFKSPQDAVQAASPATTPSYSVSPAPAVRRNSVIRLRYEQGPLLIESDGRALGSGEIGDRILVMNASSRKTFSALVSGKDEATVK